jgi:hypothetical protein
MCLYNPEKIDTEGKDIKVYKVITVKTDRYGSVVYRSPYFAAMKSSVWNIGETNHSEPFMGSYDEPVVKRMDDISGEEKYVVSGNAFHSFKNLSDAIDEMKYLLWTESTGRMPFVCNGEYKIGRFTIPGDSKYVYLGDTLMCTPPAEKSYALPAFNSFAKSYASESLRFDGLAENEI